MTRREIIELLTPYWDSAQLYYLYAYVDLCLSNDGVNESYKERHHILPKSVFNDYANFRSNSWNCATLKARTHFKAHYILANYSLMTEMKYSFWLMCNSNQKENYEVLSEEYERGRILFSQTRKGKSYKWSAEAKARFKRPKTKEHAENISKGRTGIIFSEEHKKNISLARANQVFSQESLDKRSKSISSLIWANNGKKNTRITPHDFKTNYEPKGWTRGQLRK